MILLTCKNGGRQNLLGTPGDPTSTNHDHAHLRQDLPGHNDDLQRLEWNKPPQARDHASFSYPDLARDDVGDHGNGNDQDRHRKDAGKNDATRAVGALAAREAQCWRVPIATNGAVWPNGQRRKEKGLRLCSVCCAHVHV